MTESDRDTLLEEIGVSATALGDPIINAMIEKMRRQLTTGKGLDG
jgi:hypothetical protein